MYPLDKWRLLLFIPQQGLFYTQWQLKKKKKKEKRKEKKKKKKVACWQLLVGWPDQENVATLEEGSPFPLQFGLDF